MSDSAAVRKLMKAWGWVAYPVAVFAVIWMSASWFLGSAETWQKLALRRDEIQAQEERLAKLKQKVARLSAANLSTERQNLDFLTTAVPFNKQVPAVLAQLSAAGTTAGAVVETVRGAVGDVSATESARPVSTADLVLTATFTVGGIEQTGVLLSDLERRLPLLKVRKVQLASGRLEVEVEGVWSALPKLVGEADQPLPETEALVTATKTKLAGFAGLGEVAATDSGSVAASPF